ncbi:chromate transporter [Pelosinus sp. IPA-1]|uniref:chromate transporter n=1 Tax=Pelosinus sp. IPA-1 TaxID=3029569 RepID=UPI00243627BA|nr:chromate transporter [Pelosinus sp. IPA-1]GMB00078.1 chromate transporter [Pelosinus sp. IPA-1]
MDWIMFLGVVLKSVLFSTGGFGPLPSLHADFIANGWASEKQFTEALAIGQITPGPNGLWVVSLCYLVAGVPGAVLACIALILPPLLILIVQRCHACIANHPATQGLLDGVVLVIASFSVIVLAGIFRSNGLDIGMIAIVVISATLAISRRVSANIILVSAALVGFILG